MIRHRVILALLAMLIAMVGSGLAFAATRFPEPVGYVNDFAGILTQRTVTELEGTLKTYEEQSGNEIAVVTVRDLQGTTVEDFAVRLFEKWKIGKKVEDNGALLLITAKERKIRIEVGYGLEPDLTDAEAYNIINNTIAPAFKASDYDRGVTAGVDAMMKAISGSVGPGAEPALPDEPRSWVDERNLPQLLYPIAFMVFVVLQWFAAIMARTRSWWLGGLIGALIGLAIALFSVVLGIIAIVILTPLGFLFDYVISRIYEEYGKHRDEERDVRRIPWWAGGHWGPGGFGGGGGFGGFGGGRSGGGGASGGW
ncbi:MAG TPA: TPM domain-containing protein [Anaerolineae bacterium]|jgi:uncharacterized protein|nr:TPM domain-containing protein [Anaerolineae bacterium]